MKKIYSYQKRFVYIEAPLYSLIGMLIIFSWFPTIMVFLAYGAIYPSAVRFGLFLDLTTIIVVLIISLIKSDLKKKIFAITDEAIIFKASEKIKPISFSDITLCKHMQSFKEFIQITSSDKTIRLPFSINGIYDLILHLHERLIASGNSSVLDEPSSTSMINSALIRKHAYQREKIAFLPLILSTFFLTFFNMIMAYKYWDFDIMPVIMWSIVGFLMPLNTFAFAEYLINQNMNISDNKHINDLPIYKFKNGTTEFYLLSSLLFLVIYLTIGILFKAFF